MQLSELKKIISPFAGKKLFLSLVDENGRIVSANAKMNKCFNLQEQDRSCFFSLIHPGQLESFRKLLADSRKGSGSWVELYLKNHHYHPMKWQANYLGPVNGKGKTFLCMGYSLEEERPEISNPGVESIFKSFLDKTPNLAWVVDTDANLIFASKAFYKFFRLNEKDVIQTKIFNHLPVDIVDALYMNYLEVLEKQKPVHTVEKIKWVNGYTFFFHINLFPIEARQGKMLVGGIAVDITEKHKTEKKLLEANERLLLLSRATSDAIWEWDMQTGYIFRNDTLMEMVGYHAENSKGLSWWLRRIHPEDRNRVADTIKVATDHSRHSWEDQYRFKCADGEYKHIQDRGYIVYENGLPVRMIGSLQDISELRALEDKLVNEKLNLQKELSETVIRVQEKERTRIGHELHDNVNQILSTTKLLVEMLNPSSNEEKKIREKTVEYILMAIDEIRKLSKELVVPQLRKNSLVESIEAMISDIEFSGSVKIKFTHDFENGLLTSGKKVTLFRILQEQLKNILKHSRAGQVAIFLQCKAGHVHLIIRDDGIGFDPKQASRGIGLSNIHERTLFYNGTVEVQTAPQQGCTLTVKIPID
jgi:PAS domain S-box-containing protein